jgi:hypothetical protein
MLISEGHKMHGLWIAGATFFLVTLAACRAPTSASPQPAPVPGVEVVTHVDYVALSTEDAIRQASAIVIGQVEHISAPCWNQDSGEYWDDSGSAMSSLLYYEATLVVEASIRRGYQPGEKITLTILGYSPDESFLQTGERVLVMLEKRAIAWRTVPRERIVVVGGPQGKYHLTQDGQALNAADPGRSMGLEQLLAQIASATTPKDKGAITLQSPRAPTSTATAELLPTLPTPTPIPLPTASGTQTPADLRQRLDNYPDELKLILDEEVAVIFADPNSLAEWVGTAFIYHIPSLSEVVLDFEGEVDPRYTRYNTDEGRRQLETVLTDEASMGRIRGRIRELWDQAPSATATPPSRAIPSLAATRPPILDVFPLEMDATWGYSVTLDYEEGGEIHHWTGPVTQTITSSSQRNAAWIFLAEESGGHPLRAHPYDRQRHYVAIENRVYELSGPRPVEPLIHSDGQGYDDALRYVWPMRVGDRWGDPERIEQGLPGYTWDVKERGVVQTSAGRFEACYRLVFSANTGQEQDWFCPGIGRVRREYHHNGSRLDEVWELQAFYTSTTTIPTPSTKPAEQAGAGGQPPVASERGVDCADQAAGLPDTLQIITADGAQLAFAGEGGGVTLLNLATGQTQTFSQTLSVAGWSPSGQHLLLGYSEFRYRGNFVVPWQAFWAPPEALPGATDWLALAMADGALLAVSVPGGQCYRVLPPGSLGEGGVGSILWSADGWLAWTGGLDHLAQTETWTQTLYLRPAAGAEVITRSLSSDIRETYYQLITWVPGTRLILAAEGMLANSLWSWGVPLVTINFTECPL